MALSRRIVSMNRWLAGVLLLIAISGFNIGCRSNLFAAAASSDSGTLEADDPWAEADPQGSAVVKEKIIEVPEPPRPVDLRQLLKELTVQQALRQFGKEIGLTALVLVYIVVVFVGRRQNWEVQYAWRRAFCTTGGVFDRNFALVGTGDPKARNLLTQESGSQYKLYCSGRRHCKYLTATLDLKKRQDLFSLALGLLFPDDDHVDIEVVMNEASMPQLVLAVATKKAMKAMLHEESGETDVRKLARKMEVSRDRIASWPSDKLVIHAEHSSVFYDLMPEHIQEQIFSRAAFEKHGKYFRYLHFTSEQSFGPKDQRAVLRFSFQLPPKQRMEELARLMTMVGVFIDIVGSYKLTPDMKKRAEKLRQDMEKRDAKDKEKERQEALEEKRLAKRAEEQEKLRRMTPEQREKHEQRKQKIETGRMQRKYTRKG